MGLSGKSCFNYRISSGEIGKAIALELAQHGASIVINDILSKSEIDKLWKN